MAYTKASGKAVNKYIKNNYDQIMIRVPKGDRERYKDFAAEQGKSLNSLVIELIEEKIKSGS